MGDPAYPRASPRAARRAVPAHDRRGARRSLVSRDRGRARRVAPRGRADRPLHRGIPRRAAVRALAPALLPGLLLALAVELDPLRVARAPHLALDARLRG